MTTGVEQVSALILFVKLLAWVSMVHYGAAAALSFLALDEAWPIFVANVVRIVPGALFIIVFWGVR